MVKIIPIYILVIILIALVVFKCGSKTQTETIYKTVHTTDTLINYVDVEHTNLKVDTVIKTDSIVVLDLDTHEYGYALHEYHYKINDSLLNATIIAKSPFKPDIDFKYKLKNFTIKDSVYTEKTQLKGFYYGGEIVLHPLLNQMFIGVAYQDNKGQIFDVSIGRDFVQNNNLLKVGFKKRF